MLHIVQLIHNWLILHWVAVSALVGGGTGLSVFLEVALHKLHIDSKKTAYALIHILSIGSAAAAFYLDNVNAVGAYAGLVIIAQTAHRFFISPYYNKYVVPYLTFLTESAAQPVTGYEVPADPVLANPEMQEQTPAFVV